MWLGALIKGPRLWLHHAQYMVLYPGTQVRGCVDESTKPLRTRKTRLGLRDLAWLPDGLVAPTQTAAGEGQGAMGSYCWRKMLLVPQTQALFSSGPMTRAGTGVWAGGPGFPISHCFIS